MPDLATHVLAGWMVGRSTALFRPVAGRTIYLFTLGNALPDLLARAPHLALGNALVERATRPLHTPAALVLIALAASFLFEETIRRSAFAALALGALLHCVLDFCQDIGPAYGYAWLYPLSDWSPQLSLFSGDRTVLFLPYLLAAAAALELASWLRSWTRKADRRSAGEA